MGDLEGSPKPLTLGARLTDMGAPTWPPNPQRSGRPGKAVAPLDDPLVRPRFP
jgi:hypothetical protein